MNIKHLIHVLDNQRISNGYITVAAEEVQRHYRAHHRYRVCSKPRTCLLLTAYYQLNIWLTSRILK